MAATKYRLLSHLQESPYIFWDYLRELTPSGAVAFTDDPREALLLDSWDDYAAAAAQVLKVRGPCDVMYEQVTLVSVRRSADARNTQ